MIAKPVTGEKLASLSVAIAWRERAVLREVALCEDTKEGVLVGQPCQGWIGTGPLPHTRLVLNRMRFGFFFYAIALSNIP